MICWILLLIKLSCCVCAPTFEVNATQSFYRAKEKQNVTMEWTFPPPADGSLTSLHATCLMVTDVKVFTLFELIGGVSEDQHGQFAGRVHCDTDVLKEGRLRFHVSSLRTEDSGHYVCEMMIDGVVGVGECLLNVSGVKPRKSPDERKDETPSPPPTSPPPTSPPPNKNQSRSLSAGGIVGIVVAFVGLIGVILGVFLYKRRSFYRNRRQPGADREEETPFQ